MTQGFVSYQPERDNVVLEVKVDGGNSVKLDRWKEYSFSSNFLLPTDSFTFVVAGDQINKINRNAIIPGANATCTVNGRQQVDARIDTVQYQTTRSGGIELVIQGRDKLAHMIESGINPTLKFNPQMTLLEFLAEVFGPFGFGASSFEVSNDDNVAVMSRNVRGVKTRKRDTGGAGGLNPGKVKTRTLRSYTIHQLRPYPNEGAFAFASRVCQRMGLWLWLSADGKKVIASKPSYDKPPIYDLRRTFGNRNDILDATIGFDYSEQPSIIFADGFSGGSEYGHSRIRAYAENPVVDCDNSALIAEYAKSGAVKVTIPFTGKKFKLPPRPVYLHDDEAKDQTQLENFVRRELSLKMRRSLSVRLTVVGHEQNGNNWTVDTMCYLLDEVTGLNENMWILGRTYKKSRSGGTTTDLELIRPNSLSF